ncbi:lymphokine-activated killer T-cell-originated protein kinase-like [Drosophila guanche]|uniref:Blast:Lymphokine-activated killer T-cell-originated protein kinase n=1 Tax=Drosophila guanche TaxID=7266 RepID=A0A3B0JHI7_DROGU|nr:lymphokine-activated killer T-cell-originated protein kinase-like [Drosophila guanche]SPP81807.1 blast:Lymphokine-activated killer T-cell-originated protein kinase [Drosophila guanche]
METPPRKSRKLSEDMSSTIRIPASPMMKTLGFGSGVKVYRLDRSPRHGQNRTPWAIKRITQDALEKKDLIFNERILHEAKILKKLKHPNIVQFCGLVTTDEGLNTLVLEICGCSLGSMLDARREENLGPLPAKLTNKVIADVARALDFLHTEARVLHGDLKSFNVLINGGFENCKLCDFGVALPLDKHGQVNSSRVYEGTDLWSAPEVIQQSKVLNSKADIFSFGLVIYETLALVLPHTLNMDFAEDKENQQTDGDLIEELSDFKKSSLLLPYGTRPALPVAFQVSEEHESIVALFFLCTNTPMEDRPTARNILLSIEEGGNRA